MLFLRKPFFISVLMILACAASPAFALKSVTVMADNSMGVAIAEIARNYSRDAGVAANTSFAPPLAQELQIAEGGSADILITPKQQWIEQLKTQGLIDVYSPTSVARNQLVLVGPADNTFSVDWEKPFPVAALINAMGGEQAFVVGNPETQMSGVYGKEALRYLGVSGDLEPYTLYIKETDQMRDMITESHAYGIFLYSATIGRDGMRVIDIFPQASHHPINYFAVVVAGENMDEARKFLEYLKTPDAKKIFRENGFLTD